MSAISQSALLSELASAKATIARMEALLGGEVPLKAAKAKKVKDPNAPKKDPNVWIQFTTRVAGVLKAAAAAATAAGNAELAKSYGGPATIGKQFASFLKEQKSYDEWQDSEIVETFGGWEKPEVSKAAKAKSESGSVSGDASDAASGSAPEKKERKKREPMSDEAKAAMKAKRAATIAAKPAAAAAAAAAAAPVAPVAAPAAPAAPAAAKAKASKKVVKPSYTLEQLKDFEEKNIDGENYAVNARGDVANDECEFIGHWNGSSIEDAAEPADWASLW